MNKTAATLAALALTVGSTIAMAPDAAADDARPRVLTADDVSTALDRPWEDANMSNTVDTDGGVQSGGIPMSARIGAQDCHALMSPSFTQSVCTDLVHGRDIESAALTLSLQPLSEGYTEVPVEGPLGENVSLHHKENSEGTGWQVVVSGEDHVALMRAPGEWAQEDVEQLAEISLNG